MTDSHSIPNLDNLTPEARARLEAIEYLQEPCDKRTYGRRLDEMAKKLGCTRRTVQRLVARWRDEGIGAILRDERADKDRYRVAPEWTDFIARTYREGNKGSKRMSPAQVYLRVRARAEQLEINAPGRMTVYRILRPLIETTEKPSPRNVGWRGDKVSVSAKDGIVLDAACSNQVWQCDHTSADILLVDKEGNHLGRPWLTIIVDTYSRCVVGMNLGYDAPSSRVVALALRHAILPKHYSTHYGLKNEWGTYGKPVYLFTDSGTDFKSNHAQQIAVGLDISWHFRSRPSEGGIVERVFNSLNTGFFSTLPGYTGSNVQERPEDAEKDACLTLADLERLLVRYLVDVYNQSIDARMADQTRYQRWESGLSRAPDPIGERELDICLMRKERRTVYRGGYLKFENLTYRSELLTGYAGESVNIRFDPSDITGLHVYTRGSAEIFIATAHAQDLEAETLSLVEARASTRQLREKGKTVSNRSILAETVDREAFLKQKASKKRRQQEEQEVSRPRPELEKEVKTPPPLETGSKPRPRVFDYQELIDDYGL